MYLFPLLHHSNVFILKYPKAEKIETKNMEIHTQTSGGKKTTTTNSALQIHFCPIKAVRIPPFLQMKQHVLVQTPATFYLADLLNLDLIYFYL